MEQDKNNNACPADESGSALKSVQEKFNLFLTLLDRNNHALEIMSDMEEKSQGGYLFDITYIRESLEKVRAEVRDIINCIISFGGKGYVILRDRYDEINGVIESVLPGRQPIVEDEFTVPFERLNRTRAFSVGSKNAQLGEMKAVLGLPVPEGFAITARAYKYFVDANNLQARISRRIESLDFKSYDDLVRISKEIRDMVTASPVPPEVADHIRRSFRDLAGRSPTDRVSMRSSAVGEDSLFSFAGQYASYLNVREDELIDRYREVLAGKFTPQAIYYFLSHSLSEAELAMSVGCVSMVDAAASGVVYTRNPIDPDDDAILITAVFGLGKYLVTGRLTPDEFRVSRADGRIQDSRVADKPVRLIMHPEAGTMEEPVPPEDRKRACLGEEHIRQLAEYAARLEDHYRRPQDIEWAVDREGRLFLLQSRPLQTVRVKSDTTAVDTSGYEVVLAGGTTVSPGAGSGPVHHVKSVRDLPEVPEGVVLVAPHPFPGLITIFGKIHALVSRVGGVASHMATIAREYHVPTLVGVDMAGQLPAGREVTVDATGGAIYAGRQQELVEARRPAVDLFEDSSIHRVLDRVLDLVSPLRLLHPTDEDFLPENCMTFHDITRYAHQKAMEEMFQSARAMDRNEVLGICLKSKIPLDMHVVYIDRDMAAIKRGFITEDEIDSEPMRAFWAGVTVEGWPSRPGLVSPMAVRGTDRSEREHQIYAESSFAVLSREYMIVSLFMGYHFTTVEAMCTGEPSKNYISMQYKEGGAALDRRIRRIKLVTEILSHLGFVQQRKSDFLHSFLSYQDRHQIQDKLHLLGRLTIMTKQLDMALSNDAVTEWYTRDFLKKLGLGGETGISGGSHDT